jgi:hypothetical protein
MTSILCSAPAAFRIIFFLLVVQYNTPLSIQLYHVMQMIFDAANLLFVRYIIS